MHTSLCNLSGLRSGENHGNLPVVTSSMLQRKKFECLIHLAHLYAHSHLHIHAWFVNRCIHVVCIEVHG